MNEQVKQAQQLCPRCKKPYIGYPAISRVDNETHICSECGLEESIIAMVTIDKKKLQGTFSHQQIKPWFEK